MIITNWPNHCPKCQNTKFEVTSQVKSKVFVRGSAADVALPQGDLQFRCRSDSCGNAWTTALSVAVPIIATKDETAFAVIADSVEAAQTLLALDSEYVFRPLSFFINRGAKRIRYVTAEAAKQLDGTGSGSIDR